MNGDPEKLRVLSLEPGSVQATMAIAEDMCKKGQNALEVAQEVQKQAADPLSALRKGGVTSAVTRSDIRCLCC